MFQSFNTTVWSAALFFRFFSLTLLNAGSAGRLESFALLGVIHPSPLLWVRIRIQEEEWYSAGVRCRPGSSQHIGSTADQIFGLDFSAFAEAVGSFNAEAVEANAHR